LEQYLRSLERSAQLWCAIKNVASSTDHAQQVVTELERMREMCAHLSIDCTDNISRLLEQTRGEPDGGVVMALIREVEQIITKELRQRVCLVLTKAVNASTVPRCNESVEPEEIAL
jgi:hypothetical protein